MGRYDSYFYPHSGYPAGYPSGYPVGYPVGYPAGYPVSYNNNYWDYPFSHRIIRPCIGIIIRRPIHHRKKKQGTVVHAEVLL